jgi:hypothetical protein
MALLAPILFQPILHAEVNHHKSRCPTSDQILQAQFLTERNARRHT